MIDSDRNSKIFFLIIFISMAVSISITFYRYMVIKDFKYFTKEDDIPAQFEIDTYTN